MKLAGLAAGIAPMLVGFASAAKRPMWMYLNADLKSWIDVCPDIMTMVNGGATHILLSFYENGVWWGGATTWLEYSPEQRRACLAQIHGKGAKLLLSTGGANEVAYHVISGHDYGVRAAQEAIKYDLDGLDFDLEHLPPGFESDGHTYKWLKDCSTGARETFIAAGKHDAIIAHAPQTPYATVWGGPSGGYIKLIKELGDIVDAYLFQFYNQEICDYLTYDTIFKSTPSACWAPKSAWAEMAAALGNEKRLVDKVVVGKPATTRDVYNTGFVASPALGEIFCRAEKELGYVAGIMAWAYRGEQDTAEFLRSLGGEMCGDGSSGPAPPTPTEKPPTGPAPTPSPTPKPTAAPPAPTQKPPASGVPCVSRPGYEPWAAYCVLADCATTYEAYCIPA